MGGRFSLWSAIGLPIAISIGPDAFRALLDGAAAMDAHFCEAPADDNAPLLLALAGLWANNFLDAGTCAVVPYDDRLARLPDYLQQLDMESNGKRTTLTNESVGTHTAPVTWGGTGTNAQHAFFQLLHQGTRLVPVEFVLPLTHPAARTEQHDMMVANCLAQARALMTGRDGAGEGAQLPSGIDAGAHRATPGNRPSTLITVDALTPRTLGALLALYEHRTYVQSVIWNINAFDQWGVELGKTIADRVSEAIASRDPSLGDDPATARTLARFLALRER